MCGSNLRKIDHWYTVIYASYRRVAMGVVIGSWGETVRWLTGDDGSSWMAVLGICRCNPSSCSLHVGDFVVLLSVFALVCSLIVALIVFIFGKRDIQVTLPYAIGISWGILGIFVNPTLLSI